MPTPAWSWVTSRMSGRSSQVRGVAASLRGSVEIGWEAEIEEESP